MKPIYTLDNVCSCQIWVATDEAERIYRLMMSDSSEPINIGNKNEMTMQELAELVIKIKA
jgi:hypothetical protein